MVLTIAQEVHWTERSGAIPSRCGLTYPIPTKGPAPTAQPPPPRTILSKGPRPRSPHVPIPPLAEGSLSDNDSATPFGTMLQERRKAQ